MNLIRIGRIVSTHGLSGAVKIVPYSENIGVIDKLTIVSMAKNGEIKRSHRVKDIEYRNDYLLVHFEGIDCVEKGEKIKGLEIVIPDSMLPNEEEDEIYWYKIDGADVFDTSNEYVGKLSDYIECGSCDVFKITDKDGKSYLISNNKDHVVEINAMENIVVINRIGLVDEDL